MRTKEITKLRTSVELAVKRALLAGVGSSDVLCAISEAVDAAARAVLPVPVPLAPVRNRRGWLLQDARSGMWLSENGAWTNLAGLGKLYHFEREAVIESFRHVGCKVVPCTTDAAYRDESLCKHPEFSNHIAGGE